MLDLLDSSMRDSPRLSDAQIDLDSVCTESDGKMLLLCEYEAHQANSPATADHPTLKGLADKVFLDHSLL